MWILVAVCFCVSVFLFSGESKTGKVALPPPTFPGVREISSERIVDDDASPPFLAIARFLGNNMVPLQGVSQGTKNAEYILQHESAGHGQMLNVCTEEGECASVFKFWVLNRILNATEESALSRTLKAANQSVLSLHADLKGLMESIDPPLYATNQNPARNIGLSEAEATGALWLMALDGNNFVTDEGMNGIVRQLRMAELLGKKYSLIPMYRLLRNQRLLMNSSTKIEDITDVVAFQESQLAIRWDAPFRYSEVGNQTRYGDNNKFQLLRLVKKFNRPLLHCVEANAGYGKFTKLNVEAEKRRVGNCGAVYRLNYHSGNGDDSLVLKIPALRIPLRMASLETLRNQIAHMIEHENVARSLSWI